MTKGLSASFPDRVWTTPLSEAAMVGVATGMAMRGVRPIVEIMFGDFLSLSMDQMLNHLAKFTWMYNGQVRTPVVIRTPMGGGRGYGPTHSQSIEKHFCGIPGLAVLAVSRFGDPGALLRRAVEMDGPCLVIENKLMYAQPVVGPDALPRHPAPDLVIVTYGGGGEVCLKAAEILQRDEEVLADVVVVEQLSPLPRETVQSASRRAAAMLIVEEGTSGWGFAGECALAVGGGGPRIGSVAALSQPIPNSRPWEDEVLPGPRRVAAEALALLGLAEP